MGTGLYVHIPFCVKKCDYCDFYSVGTGNDLKNYPKKTVDMIGREIGGYFSPNEPEIRDVSRKTYTCSTISTVYIGGGTPSVVPVDIIEPLLERISGLISRDEYTEWTIECNPGTVDESKLRLYKNAGINRLSIGCQSTSDDELRTLGRIHDFEVFLRTYSMAREAGFDNINVDLMSAIPGQTLDTYCETLQTIIGLDPEHISAYSLIIEPGTRFYEKYKDVRPVNEDDDADMYQMACRLLKEAGYEHYEVSNFAKPGHECRHNINYWKRGSYIGVGPSAAGFLRDEGRFGKRYVNIRDIARYTKLMLNNQPVAVEKETLNRRQALIEELYLGLRMSEGIDLDRWYSSYPKLYKNWINIIDDLIDNRLASVKDGRMMLTDDGLWLGDGIFDRLFDDDLLS